MPQCWLCSLGMLGFMYVSRAALNMGVSKLVFPVYRNIIALLLLLPFAYFLEKYVHFTYHFSFFMNHFSGPVFISCFVFSYQEGKACYYLFILGSVLPTGTNWVWFVYYYSQLSLVQQKNNRNQNFLTIRTLLINLQDNIKPRMLLAGFGQYISHLCIGYSEFCPSSHLPHGCSFQVSLPISDSLISSSSWLVVLH